MILLQFFCWGCYYQVGKTMKNICRISSALTLRALTVLIAYSIINLICFSGLSSESQIATAATTGDKLYTANCAACHQDGQNLMNPKKPVIGSTKLENKQSFKSFLLKPTGAMTPYPAIANNDADVTALYNYCKSLKKK